MPRLRRGSGHALHPGVTACQRGSQVGSHQRHRWTPVVDPSPAWGTRRRHVPRHPASGQPLSGASHECAAQATFRSGAGSRMAGRSIQGRSAQKAWPRWNGDRAAARVDLPLGPRRGPGAAVAPGDLGRGPDVLLQMAVKRAEVISWRCLRTTATAGTATRTPTGFAASRRTPCPPGRTPEPGQGPRPDAPWLASLTEATQFRIQSQEMRRWRERTGLGLAALSDRHRRA